MVIHVLIITMLVILIGQNKWGGGLMGSAKTRRGFYPGLEKHETN